MKNSKTINRWVILVASCIINLCIGSVYAWSVFSPAMAAYLTSISGLDITPEQLSIVFTVANLLGPITMISGGKINDTLGPRIVLILGGVMFGVGLLISGFSTSVGMLILGYGIISGLGLGFAYGCTVSNSVKFFPDKKGLIGGIATASYGLSSVILPPVAAMLIEKIGICATFKTLGIVFGIIVCVAALFIQKCPEGYAPEGYTAPAGAAAGGNDKNWKQMLASPVFYVMLITLICGAFAGMMCISQASSIAQKMIGMSAAAAATAVSILALFNAAGRIAAGRLSDSFGRINTLSTACVLEAIGGAFLFAARGGNIVLFFIGIVLIGFAFGSFMGVYPGFTAEQFGIKYNSVNYGIIFIGFATAGYVGPLTMRKIYGATGVYSYAFVVAMCISIMGLVLTFVCKKLNKKGE